MMQLWESSLLNVLSCTLMAVLNQFKTFSCVELVWEHRPWILCLGPETECTTELMICKILRLLKDVAPVMCEGFLF